MSTKGITAKAFAVWIIPQEALHRVEEITAPEFAAKAVIGWLKGGFLRAAAAQSSRRGTLFST